MSQLWLKQVDKEQLSLMASLPQMVLSVPNFASLPEAVQKSMDSLHTLDALGELIVLNIYANLQEHPFQTKCVCNQYFQACR